jgi:hypothetical protein
LGHFRNIKINKSNGCYVKQGGDLNLFDEGNLILQQGQYILNGGSFSISGNIDIYNSGNLHLEPSSTLNLGAGKNINIHSGGKLEIAGVPGMTATIQAMDESASYAFNVNSGATIAADYAIFRNMGIDGVHVYPGGIIEPQHAFTGCTFRNGKEEGTLLTINNSQNITIQDAIFPANLWDGRYNVLKTEDSGQVRFLFFSGEFSGEDHDKDPFERIDWSPVSLNTTVAGTVQSPDPACYDAFHTITVGGDATPFTVQNGGSVILIAGQNILFLPGSTVLNHPAHSVTMTSLTSGAMPKSLMAPGRTIFPGCLIK